MVYFSLLNKKPETPDIIKMIKENCGGNALITEKHTTTVIYLGTRYQCMIYTNEFDGAILNIYDRFKDNVHLKIRCVDINTILELN